MLRILIALMPLLIGCGHGVTCKLLQTDCVEDLELFTCIDPSNQIWYEFSDGKQIACFGAACEGDPADEAAAYCDGKQWTPPED